MMRVLLAGVTALPTALAYLVLAALGDMERCGDSCRIGPYAHGWKYFSNSPQWSIQLWLVALPGFVLVLLYVLFVVRGRWPHALIAFTCGYVLFIGWLIYSALSDGQDALMRFGNGGSFVIVPPLVVAVVVVLPLVRAADRHRVQQPS